MHDLVFTKRENPLNSGSRLELCASLLASDFRLGPVSGSGSVLAVVVQRASEGLLLREEALLSRFLPHQPGR